MNILALKVDDVGKFEGKRFLNWRERFVSRERDCCGTELRPQTLRSRVPEAEQPERSPSGMWGSMQERETVYTMMYIIIAARRCDNGRVSLLMPGPPGKTSVRTAHRSMSRLQLPWTPTVSLRFPFSQFCFYFVEFPISTFYSTVFLLKIKLNTPLAYQLANSSGCNDHILLSILNCHI